MQPQDGHLQRLALRLPSRPRALLLPSRPSEHDTLNDGAARRITTRSRCRAITMHVHSHASNPWMYIAYCSSVCH